MLIYIYKINLKKQFKVLKTNPTENIETELTTKFSENNLKTISPLYESNFEDNYKEIILNFNFEKKDIKDLMKIMINDSYIKFNEKKQTEALNETDWLTSKKILQKYTNHLLELYEKNEKLANKFYKKNNLNVNFSAVQKWAVLINNFDLYYKENNLKDDVETQKYLKQLAKQNYVMPEFKLFSGDNKLYPHIKLPSSMFTKTDLNKLKKISEKTKEEDI